MKINQKGQVIIVLLLLMLVGLSIGLALTQRSVTDVTTSTQEEQSSRAFSAAEAGLEKALSGSLSSGSTVTFNENNSSAQVSLSADLPVNNTYAAIEYPPVGRETPAQFWFVNPSDSVTPVYSRSSVDLYFGNANTTDKPAVEVSIVMQGLTNFFSKTYYFDSDTTRAATNGFIPVSNCGSTTLATTVLGSNRVFYCKKTIGDGSPAANVPFPDLENPGNACPNSNCRIIMARVRLLYANENHPIALAPASGTQFPPQVQIYNATGTSGLSEKQLQAFKVKDVIAPWFDFAVFSVNQIKK